MDEYKAFRLFATLDLSDDNRALKPALLEFGVDRHLSRAGSDAFDQRQAVGLVDRDDRGLRLARR